MTQKNKVKELVGRGLNSYHTKALQQINRIEKKNKEQNHKISILSNELDNDYLTKTEEGSVISLEHSKEGMVYLDELQGNTLVNYCTDGSKEMTLNGDIDVEGTFVTTTEGVDNGKVDVMCEGNTLVNILKTNGNWFDEETTLKTDSNIAVGLSHYQKGFDIKLLKSNTLYTVIPYVDYSIVTKGEVYIQLNTEINNAQNSIFRVYETSFNKPTLITTSNLTNLNARSLFIGGLKCEYKFRSVKILILEGDWTNREIPPYFEGMKSVGQDNENGHKIEILSQNYQELNTDTNGLVCHLKAGTSTITNNIMSDLSGNGNNAILYGASINGNYLNFNGESDYATIDRCVSDDFTISLKAEVISAKGGSLGNNSHWYNYASLVDGEYPGVANDFGLTITNEGYPCLGIGKPDTTVRHKETCFNKLTTFTYTRNKTTGEMKLYIDGKHSATISSTNKNSLNDNPLITIGRSATKTTAYAKMKFYELKIYNKVLNESEIFKFNKKEILMREPLRKANDFHSDRLVKIGSKWFIERNTKKVVLDGTQNVIRSSTSVKDETLCRFDFTINGLMKGSSKDKQFICDTLPYLFIHELAGGSTTVAQECITNHSADENFLNMVIKKSRLETIDVVGLNKWLRNNNIKIVIPIATPIYEPLEIEPTLNTYNDVTHISNNSIIPCNMKIQNSGYNAIIKPSTLYTVALDTNKSGTVGVNLGGAKGTTTNNVAIITTPATLADDSLRIYGKGIKGSKVRLLEGDKTNWIPSHFEGMKSSFEDKLQEDGSYKMEILSNNKNLFDIDAKRYYAGWGEHNYQKYKNGFSFCSKNGWNSIGYTFESLKNKTVTVCATVTCVNKDTSKQQEQHFSIIPVEYGYPTSVIFRDGETKKVKFNITLKDNGRVYFIGASNNEGSNEGGIQWFLEDISVVEGIENDYISRECNKIQFSSIEPLRGVGDVKDRFVFKDGKLMVERNCGYYIFNENTPWIGTDFKNKGHWIRVDDNKIPNYKPNLKPTLSIPSVTDYSCWSDNDNELEVFWDWAGTHMYIFLHSAKTKWDVKVNYSTDDISDYMKDNPVEMVYELAEPTYEEIPFELQKIILEGYENGTLFFDTNIPPTSTVRYAGETPIVKSVKLNKAEVSNNTDDINDNIIPYLMDMDYRVVCLQLATEEIEGGVSVARLFGGAYEMLKRDILSKRLTREEYGYRLADYFNAGKLTEEQVRELEDLR